MGGGEVGGRRGYGGDAHVTPATGLACETIRKGRLAIARGVAPVGRLRRPGAGRPSIQTSQPGIKGVLESLVDPLRGGDPTLPLRWTCKCRAKLDKRTYPTGGTASKSQMDNIALMSDTYHGEWYYDLLPRSRGARGEHFGSI